MACSEPDGVMDQEAEYLAVLQRAASYSTDLTDLELFDSNGVPIAEFVFGGRHRGNGHRPATGANDHAARQSGLVTARQVASTTESSSSSLSLIPDATNRTATPIVNW